MASTHVSAWLGARRRATTRYDGRLFTLFTVLFRKSMTVMLVSITVFLCFFECDLRLHLRFTFFLFAVKLAVKFFGTFH